MLFVFSVREAAGLTSQRGLWGFKMTIKHGRKLSNPDRGAKLIGCQELTKANQSVRNVIMAFGCWLLQRESLSAAADRAAIIIIIIMC